MNNTISPVNFCGYWEIGAKRVKTVAGATRVIMYERIYHPLVGESQAEISKSMRELHSGWSYGIWNLHPNGGQRNKGGIYELFVPKLGEAIQEANTDRFIKHSTMLDLENVFTDETTFKLQRNNDHFRLCDVKKLTKERVSELVAEYFPKGN